jgi:hypothetical protein
MDLVLQIKAIHKLRPNTEWALDEHTGLSFKDKSIVVPTEAEIDEAVKQIKADEIAEAKAKTKAKEAAQAKLAALGLTVEDLKALGL